MKQTQTIPETFLGVGYMCFLSAFASLYGAVQAGDTVYIPGGGGGVGHLAVQMAARALGAGLVISSGSTPQSIALARQSGAHHVFNYKRDDIAAEIAKLTSGRGVDLVFDASYRLSPFIDSHKLGHDPPTYRRSMTAVRLPCEASVQARSLPGAPLPKTNTSYASSCDMCFSIAASV